MLIQELFEAAEARTVEPVTVSKSSDGRWEVATKAKTQPTLTVIFEIAKRLVSRTTSKVVVTNLKGKVTNKDSIYDLYHAKPNRIFVASEKLSDDELEALLTKTRDDAVEAVEKTERKVAKAKAQRETPAYKKQVNAIRTAKAKAANDDKEALYGKGTWKRTSIKQEGGDDGYQYVLRVDGVAKEKGMTRSEAEAAQRRAADALAKKAKIGKYAE